MKNSIPSRKSYYEYSQQQNTIQEQKVSFQQINYNEILIRTRNQDVWTILKSAMDKQGKNVKPLNKGYNGWISKADQYKNMIALVESLKVRIDTIPSFLKEAFQPFNYEKYMQSIGKNRQERPTQNQIIKRGFANLPEEIRQNLYQFQKKGIEFGIQKNCRLLIGDEMGVGKTIQSLCLAYIYRDEWPLLIICPSCLRFTIRQEILNWFSAYIQEDLIQVITKGSDKLLKKSEIVIMSYDLVSNLKDVIEVKQFQTCIIDEAHYLKSLDSLRSINIVPLIQKMKNIILLTGTPALSRPKELFNILSIIRPDVFKNFRIFGNRYCNPKLNQVVNCINYDGCDNELELSFILKEKIMIRRLKEDILPDLPQKRRKKVMVEISQQTRNKMNRVIKQADAKQFEIYLNKQMEQQQEDYFLSKDKQNVEQDDIMRKTFGYVYQETGVAKLECIKEYLTDLLENDIKFIVFAHHQIVLDEIEKMVSKEFSKAYIRIDGNVKQEERVEKVKQFQTNPQVQVAILSLQAASHGITLTASSHIVFAELFLTPAVMLQAEDRAHRINQKNTVLCHYLIAKETLDEDIFNLLLSKFMVISSIVDGERKPLEINECEEFKYHPKEELQTDMTQNQNILDNNQQDQLIDQNSDQIDIQNQNVPVEEQNPPFEVRNITLDDKDVGVEENNNFFVQNNNEDEQNQFDQVKTVTIEDNSTNIKKNLSEKSTIKDNKDSINQINNISIEDSFNPLKNQNIQKQENMSLEIDDKIFFVNNNNNTLLENQQIQQDNQSLIQEIQNAHIDDNSIKQIINFNQNLTQQNIHKSIKLQNINIQEILKLIKDESSSEDSDEDDKEYIMQVSQRAQNNIQSQHKYPQINQNNNNNSNNQSIQNNKHDDPQINKEQNQNLILDKSLDNISQSQINTNTKRKNYKIKHPLQFQIKKNQSSQANAGTQDIYSQQYVEKNINSSVFQSQDDTIQESLTQNDELSNIKIKRSRCEFENQIFSENDQNISNEIKKQQFKFL